MAASEHSGPRCAWHGDSGTGLRVSELLMRLGNCCFPTAGQDRDGATAELEPFCWRPTCRKNSERSSRFDKSPSRFC